MRKICLILQANAHFLISKHTDSVTHFLLLSVKSINSSFKTDLYCFYQLHMFDQKERDCFKMLEFSLELRSTFEHPYKIKEKKENLDV